MEKQKRTIIMLLVFFFLISLLLLKPTLTNILKFRKGNISNQEKLAKLTSKKDLLESQDKYEIGRRVEIIENIYPSKKPVLELIASIQNLASEEGVEFKGISLKPGQIDETIKVKTIEEFSISFSINGELGKISSFITKLEKTSPIMKVETFNLALQDSENTESPLTATLTVRLYYQALPETIGLIDEPLPTFTDEELDVFKRIETFKTYPKIEPNAPTGKDDLFNLL